ncbi:hypothetical protein M5689_021373 [Euphorbia peplus]|nr:hypothetical protein M5689_021373 [Euphorbia peplus]
MAMASYVLGISFKIRRARACFSSRLQLLVVSCGPEQKLIFSERDPKLERIAILKRIIPGHLTLEILRNPGVSWFANICSCDSWGP